MTIVLTGGCACGAIRYECETRPVVMLNCHCHDCQHFSGSAYAPLVVVTADHFCLMQGEPKYFLSVAQSGNTVRRGFCAECGSALFVVTAALPAYIALMAGCLDDPELFHPVADLWTRSARRWDLMDPALPRYATEPVGEPQHGA
ncbi:GFA family protein [Uliginosibacterium flavum]|uniref:GFA family protein n=1 Tax=Uliginosibacterium flavum TaxID=1396831 RepID=A0ABV2TM53_9RHOO